MSSVNPGPGLIPVVTPPGVVVNAEGFPADGDVPTYVAASNSTSWKAGGGGGSQPGAAIWRGPFSFALGDADLNTGIVVYTPTVDDLLLAAAVFTDVAFDGTTPKFDIGTGLGGSVGGLFSNVSAAVDLTIPAFDYLGDGGTLIAPPALASLVGDGIANAIGPNGGFPPFLVGAANPLKAWASQDGFTGGTAVGGTAGAGRLFICTATPVAF